MITAVLAVFFIGLAACQRPQPTATRQGTNLVLVIGCTLRADQMTPYGGPANATQVLPITIYRVAFEQLRLGKGAAASVILMLFLFVTSLLFVRVLLKRESQHEA